MKLTGFFDDPYGRHEERWISRGKPTQFVRDARVESIDPPPPDAPRLPTLREVSRLRRIFIQALYSLARRRSAKHRSFGQ